MKYKYCERYYKIIKIKIIKRNLHIKYRMIDPWANRCRCKISTNIDERCNINDKTWKKCKLKMDTVLYYLVKENTWRDSIDFRGITETFNNPHISHTIMTRFNLKPREYRELIGLFE